MFFKDSAVPVIGVDAIAVVNVFCLFHIIYV